MRARDALFAKIESIVHHPEIEVENELEMARQRSFVTYSNWSARGVVAIEVNSTLPTIAADFYVGFGQNSSANWLAAMGTLTPSTNGS